MMSRFQFSDHQSFLRDPIPPSTTKYTHHIYLFPKHQALANVRLRRQTPCAGVMNLESQYYSSQMVYLSTTLVVTPSVPAWAFQVMCQDQATLELLSVHFSIKRRSSN
jgi:hypothetical protein